MEFQFDLSIYFTERHPDGEQALLINQVYLSDPQRLPNMSMSTEECASPRSPRPVPAIPETVLEQLSMKGRLVCITGASDGIGFAVAEAMAEVGAHLALSKNGVNVKAYQVEISDAEKVPQTVRTIVEDFGRLDVFKANAGMSISRPVLETTVDEYRKQMSVNVDGTFFCAKYAGEVFKKQGWGN